MELNKILPNYSEKRESKTIAKNTFSISDNGLKLPNLTFDFEEDGQMKIVIEDNVDMNETAKVEALSKTTDETKGLGERQKNVFSFLKKYDSGATAKELSMSMFQAGLVPSPERNSVHPRLRELVKKELVFIVGSKTCQYTDRTVSIYKAK